MRSASVSIGIGTTGNCNLNCPHCYSKRMRRNTLLVSDVALLIEKGNINSINFGSGENILNPDFSKIISICYLKSIKLSLTSNGYSVIKLHDSDLQKFNDIDISLDFSSKKKQNEFRNGTSWEFATKAIEKCKRLKIEFSMATALMNINYKEIPFLFQKTANEGCNLRINVFKKVDNSAENNFALTYDEFWEAISLLFKHGKLISCSEPIVNAMLNIPSIVPNPACGNNSLRIHPNGEIVPCVYWPGDSIKMSELEDGFAPIFKSNSFRLIKDIPQFCIRNCEKVGICGGGCASRRYLNGDIYEPDEYCPIYNKKTFTHINVTYATVKKDLVHSTYLCTLIFESK